jgi:hypothetical protein
MSRDDGAMKILRPMFILLAMAVVAILVTGCTSTSQPVAVVTTEPTVTAAPTEVPTVLTCGIQTCDGLAVTCGPNVVTNCPKAINPGDRCLQYATCQVVSGSCQLVTESRYDKCVNCVEACQNSFPNNKNQVLDCSQSC